jgi:cob(I)alamin adenosyltransferase
VIQSSRPENTSGLVIVLTGNGKGKTTSALGMVMRAWGHDLRTAVFQFIKRPDNQRGETLALQRMGIRIESVGSGFTWQGDNRQTNRQLAMELWQQIKPLLKSNEYDLLVLDELTWALFFGWLDIAEVLQGLRERSPEKHVIITGRNAPRKLLDFCDCAMEIQPIKHHLQKGLTAQPVLNIEDIRIMQAIVIGGTLERLRQDYSSYRTDVGFMPPRP